MLENRAVKHFNLNKGWLLLALALILSLIWASSVQAQTKIKPILFEKVQYPGNGNYYELIDLRRTPFDHPLKSYGQSNWDTAVRLAKMLEFNGVKGRLAHITEPELDSFLRLTFRPESHVWIGIEYDCATRRLVYEDGLALTPASYTFWSPVDWPSDDWHRKFGWPVDNSNERPLCIQGFANHHGAYMAMADDRRPYWALIAGSKGWYQLFVEYPTGEKN